MGVNYQELASGKYYEELEPGKVYKHSITRTVTETDNLLFSALTHNMAWLHLDEEYSKTQMFGQRLGQQQLHPVAGGGRAGDGPYPGHHAGEHGLFRGEVSVACIHR